MPDAGPGRLPLSAVKVIFSEAAVVAGLRVRPDFIFGGRR